MDAQDILKIIHDEELAETVGLKCFCHNGDKKWCDKCDARLYAIKAYRKAVMAEIRERLT